MTERYFVAGRLRIDRRDERAWLDGRALPLGRKAYALLLELLENPQVLVTKEQLLDRAWPGLAVSESALTTGIKELRRALGDNARRPSVIETVHGRGYRFVQPVERCDDLPVSGGDVRAAAFVPDMAAVDPLPAAVSARRWPWLLAVAALVAAGMIFWLPRLALQREVPPVAATPDAKSVAVLPFTDLSPARDQQWFADGLTAEVLSRLARTPDLRVAARLTTQAQRRRTADPRALARSLGVAHILTGTVQRDGGQVRVTVDLIRAADGIQLWSQSYVRPARDVMAIQQDIAIKLSAALKTVMDPVRLRAMTDAGTRSVEAYEAYLRGLAFDQRGLEEGGVTHARAAADAYERARTLDPGFAAAQWQAAQTWFGNATRMDSRVRADEPSEAVRLARYLERVDAAIAGSNDATEQLKYQAARAVALLRFAEAYRLLARYLAARPRDIDAWEDIGEIAAYVGNRAAMAHAAGRVDALSIAAGAPRSRAITLSVLAMDLDMAATRARRQLALRPDNAVTQYQAHRALIWAGRASEARPILAQIVASSIEAESKLLARLRQVCAEGGTDVAAIRARIDAVGTLSSRWQAAQVAGDRAAAAGLLRPLDTRAGVGTLMQYLINPSFDPAPYPLLVATLTQNGIAPRRAVPMPFACTGEASRGSAPRAVQATPDRHETSVLIR